MAELEEVSESGGVAEALADDVGAVLRAVEVDNQLLQEVASNLHLK